jgi:hypothetical protein
MLFTRAAVVSVPLVLSALLVPTDSDAAAAPGSDLWLARALSASVSERASLATLAVLDRFAALTDGNRAPGSRGFELSRQLVTRTLASAGYRVTEQPVPYQRFVVDAERLTVNGVGVRVLMAQYVPSTPPGGVNGAVTVVDAAGADPTPGCQSSDFPAGPGAAAVVRSGGCSTAAKATAAAAAGSATLLVYDESPSPWTIVRRRATGTPLPVGFVSQLDAQRLERAAGSAGTVELRGHEVPDTTVNVLAETTGGSADRVVMAGAHLDSADDGPGINDNGSSVAALLQTAMRLAPLQHRVTNRVRFAFWGAEELITIGSLHYIATLPADQLAAISLYLNFEMLASPNFVRFVVDGDDSDHPNTGIPGGPPGSGAVEAVMTQGYQVQRLPFRTADLAEIRSDQEPFAAAGIPVGGAFGGVRGIKTADEAAVFGGTAGQHYDPCYHQPCDSITNINSDALGEALRAIAWAVGRFAVNNDDVDAASGR